ncbi:MAG: CBS domain-containing protein [Pseudomonadota bacterium]|nr:CBS domain-containing protein [Pseudomonadota bacterium]
MPNDTNATDYMTRPVITIGQHDTLEAAINLMIARSISSLPVVDRVGRLVGILTEGDVLRRAASAMPAAPPHWLSFLTGSGTSAPQVGRKVRDVMTRSVVIAASDATPDTIIDLMRSNRIQHVPIVEQGRLVGLICRTKLLDTFADVAVSADNSATARSVARQRWTRLNAMQMPTGRSGGDTVRNDVIDLFGVIDRSAALSHDVHQFS